MEILKQEYIASDGFGDEFVFTVRHEDITFNFKTLCMVYMTIRSGSDDDSNLFDVLGTIYNEHISAFDSGIHSAHIRVFEYEKDSNLCAMYEINGKVVNFFLLTYLTNLELKESIQSLKDHVDSIHQSQNN